MIFISTLNYSIAKSLGWTELIYIGDCYIGIPPNGKVGNMFGLKLKVPNFLLSPNKVRWQGPTENINEFDKAFMGFIDWATKKVIEERLKDR